MSASGVKHPQSGSGGEGLWSRLTQPAHQGSLFPAWLTLILLVLVGYQIYNLPISSIGPNLPIDFRTLFLAQDLWVSGENPYDDQALKSRWREIAEKEAFQVRVEPGFPWTPMLYPPWALPIWSTLLPSSYRAAYLFYYSLIPILLALIVLLAAGTVPNASRMAIVFDLLLLVLAFKALRIGIPVGQPMFLCLAFCFGALLADRKGRGLLAGVLLGLAAFKFTVAAPFAAVFLLRRRWGVVLTSLLTLLAVFGAFWVLTVEPETVLASYWESTLRMASLKMEYSEFFRRQMTSFWISLLKDRVQIANGFRLFLIGMLGLTLWAWFRSRSWHSNDNWTLAVWGAAWLCVGPNLFYDCLLLIPALYGVAVEADRRTRRLLALVVSPLVLPITGVLDLIGDPSWLRIFHMHVPMALFSLLLVLGFACRRRPGMGLEPAG